MVLGSLHRSTRAGSLLGVVVYLLHLNKLGTTIPIMSSRLLPDVAPHCSVIWRAELEPEGWVSATPFG